MAELQALLIGVPEYQWHSDLNLGPVVSNDIAHFQRSLESCGYNVQSRGTVDPGEVTRNNIARFIRDACSNAKPESTLLIYFSGHGINHGGKDLLLPYDADLTASDLASGLVPMNIGHLVAESKTNASTIVFFIDACREGVEWGKKSAQLTRLAQKEHATMRERCFLTVMACEEGQDSQYVTGHDGFSLFTHALATAFAVENSARTLDEIRKTTQAELDRLVLRFQKRQQSISWLGEESANKDWRRRVVSDYRPSPDDPTGEREWSQVIGEARLWVSFAEDEAGGLTKLLQKTAGEMAAKAEGVYRDAASSVPDDDWRDENYASRVISRLEFLVSLLPEVEFNQAEVSLLLLAPFVRETVFAAGVGRVAACDPLVIDQDPQGQNDTIGRRLRLAHMMRPRLVRAVQRLRSQASGSEQANAIALWMMNGFILREPALWKALPSAIQFATDSPEPKDHQFAPLVVGILQSERLLALAKCVGCDPSRIERTDTSHPLQSVAVIVGRDDQRIEIREQLIGFLLAVAGWMALDVREMPELVAEHVAADESLSPREFVQTLRRARWHPMGATRQLAVECGHQAIDYAIRDYVHRATESLQLVRERAHAVGGLGTLTNLPTRFGTGEVRPSQSEAGVFAYELPHISFTLDPDEIRELLMGQQLYTKPELAIRELYQNALDACRYGQARLDYLRRTNNCPGELRDLEGRIRFAHKRTGDGRPYIECTDNGVGMGKMELGECFAKAGRRFRDVPEFLEEQELWFGCVPPIRTFPNSQFGIGVFSYFMLADEIEVETCRMDRNGKLGSRLLAHMSAGGKLFHVQNVGAGNEPGTRVRLYLKDEHEQGFLASTISKFLRIAEFDTEVSDGRSHPIWNARTPDEASPSSHPHVWWVGAGKGEVLSDGIRVEKIKGAEDVKTIGAVINLTDEYMPSLSVDRNEVIEWDASWARTTIEDCLSSVATSNHLSMLQLWWIKERFPNAIESILAKLQQAEVTVPIGLVQRVEGLFKRIIFIGEFGGKLIEQEFADRRVRADRVGIDKRDIGILGFQIGAIQGQLGQSGLWKLLNETQWVGDFRSFDDEHLSVIRGDFDAALRLHHSLRRQGTLKQFGQRISAWADEGFELHPLLNAIVATPPENDYKVYRAELRRYHRQRHIKWALSRPQWLLERWKPAGIGLAIVSVLVAGFWFYPTVATFAVVTAAGLLVLGFSVFLVAEWMGW